MRKLALGLIGLATSGVVAAGWRLRNSRDPLRHRDVRELYEQLIRSDAVCRVDGHGLVIAANAEMRRLAGRESLADTELAALFDESDREFVREATTAGPPGRRHNRDLTLRRADGFSAPVRAEIGPLTSRGRWTGSYVKLRDISREVERQVRARQALQVVFDASPLGFATINAKGELTYANQAVLDIAGAKTWKGTRIRDFFPDDETYRIVAEHFNRRLQGKSEEYDVDITRLDNGARTTVRVTGIPDADLEGRPIGSVAIVRSVAHERTTAEIHRYVETTHDPEVLIRAVAEAARRHVPWDDYVVALYSRDMRHGQIVYAGENPPQRWWQMSEELIAFVQADVVQRVGDLRAFTEREGMRHLRKEPGTRWTLERGMRSFIFLPIMREGRVVASITFLSRAKDAFNEVHEASMNALPLDQAVLMALHIREERELRFHLELVRDIASASNNIHRVAQVLVESLVHQYHWSNVALFVVDECLGKLSLLHQEARADGYRLPANYSQGIDAGVLGLVRRTKQPINSGDVRNDPRTQDIFVLCVPDTRSELCVPIVVAGAVRWLLNVEDSQVNAFADDELVQVERIAAEVSALLDRASLHHYLAAVLSSASDAIIVTDTIGFVSRLNPAACRMLGRTEEEAVGQPLDRFIPEVTGPLGPEGAAVQTTSARIEHAGGETVEVLLSASPLPVEFGGRVFIVRDLSLQRRLEMLEETRRTYCEVAAQAKTPLSLAFAWLRRLQRRSAGEVADVVDRVVRQLLKVELTYDRLVLYERKGQVGREGGKVLLTLDEVVDGVIRQLPESEMKRVDWSPPTSSPSLRGDVFQLEFCVSSVVGYLLGTLPEDGRLAIALSFLDQKVTLEVRPVKPRGGPANGLGHDGGVARVTADVALGEEIIRTFMANHGGDYESLGAPPFDGFRFELPVEAAAS